jgi:hypothetical protein
MSIHLGTKVKMEQCNYVQRYIINDSPLGPMPKKSDLDINRRDIPGPSGLSATLWLTANGF